MRKRSTVFTLAAAGLFSFASVHAGEGDIDTGYGQQGYIRVDALQLLQSDGSYEPPIALRGAGNRTYLVGSMRFSGLERGYVARLRYDGSLDTAFADGAGIISLGVPDGRFEGRAAVVAADGGVVVSGLRTIESDVRPMVCKLTAAGDLDTGGFGDPQTPGCTVLPWAAEFNKMPYPDFGSGIFLPSAAIAVAPDGGYVVAFVFDNDPGLAIARLTAAGAVDMSFGGGIHAGLFHVPIGGVGQIAVKSDDSIVVTGFKRESPVDTNIEVFQVDSTGQTVLGKYTAAINLYPQYSVDVPTALAVHSNGEVAVAGFASTGDAGNAAVLLRFNESLDPIVPVDAQFPSPAVDANRQAFAVCDACVGQYVSSMAFLPDGGLMLVGSYGLDTSDSDVFAIRLTPDWTLDEAFGTQGQVKVSFDIDAFNDIPLTYDNAPSLTFQCGQRPVVVARRGNDLAESALGLTRLLSDSVYCDGFDD